MKSFSITSVFLGGLLSVLFTLPTTHAEEVPYQVFSTKMKETHTHPANKTLFYDEIKNAWKPSQDGLEARIGYYDPRTQEREDPGIGRVEQGVFVPITGVTYTLEFTNVGAMKGEPEAKLHMEYQEGPAYRIHLNTVDEMMAKMTVRKDQEETVRQQIQELIDSGKFNGENYRKKIPAGNLEIPDVTIDLKFSGGPYGTFTGKIGEVFVEGKVDEGTGVYFGPAAGYTEDFWKAGLFHFYVGSGSDGDDRIYLPFEGDGFEKWMEILENDAGECTDPENPSKDSGIRFSDIWGEALYVSCNGIMDELWEMAELDAVLHVEDRIRTGDGDSGVVLSLTDMTTFKMRPDTEVLLSEPPGKENKIRLITGKVWTNLKKMVKDGSMEIEMSEAVAGIKGTILVTSQEGNSSTLKVIEGEVEFTNRQTGESVFVKAGEAIEAKGNQLSSVTTFDIEQEKKNWEDLSTEYIETATYDTPEPTVSEPAEETENTNQNNTTAQPTSEKSNIWIWGIVLLVIVIGGFVVMKKK
jgi:hypothetical protein